MSVTRSNGKNRDGVGVLRDSAATAEPELEEALRAHSAGRSLGFMLWHTTLRWQRGVDAALAPYALTHAQFLLLSSAWWLGREGKAPNQRQVAEYAGVGEVMASQIIRILEREDLVTRTPHPDDPRGKALRVTERGRQLAEQAVVALDAADDAFFGAVPDQEQLLASLQLLADRSDVQP